jgi:PAS domain S-box-containing protein
LPGFLSGNSIHRILIPSIGWRLPRSLSGLETWGFGLSGLLLWLGVAPGMHADLGDRAIWVWLPGTIIGMMLNLQVQRLGYQQIDRSGGTPNYMTHLLSRYPVLATYGAIGYWLGWVSVPPMNAIILTDLIAAKLSAGLPPSTETVLHIGFTLLPFLLAFTGTRSLSILHLFFVLPTIGLFLTFCVQGMGWLTVSPASPGFFPSNLSGFSLTEWAKWFFLAIYAVYGCETASSFVADSQNPKFTLHSLKWVASLIPLVYVGGSWVLMRLATGEGLGDNAFLNLVAAAQPFWGNAASIGVTFLITCGAMLSSSTAVANTPRILYQLSIDGYISPTFAFISRRNVFLPSLMFTLALSLLCLHWGNVSRVVMVTGTGYLCSMLAMHIGLWLCRDQPEVRWGRISLGFAAMEVLVLFVGGWAWGWQDLLVGLLLPAVILSSDAVLRQFNWKPLRLDWWHRRSGTSPRFDRSDFLMSQVSVLIVLICSALVIGWFFGSRSLGGVELLVVLLISAAFIGVAIACWTTLPQIFAIVESRQNAEHLLQVVLDAIVLIDATGVILKVNPATERLFGVCAVQLLGTRLQDRLPSLSVYPKSWDERSEHILSRSPSQVQTIEAAVSPRVDRDRQEYLVILRDITDLKQVEAELRQSLKCQEELTEMTLELKQTLLELRQTQAQLIHTEKMSSLGQMVAGVAHEINNPVNFIYGNLTHVREYTQFLLELFELYQESFPELPLQLATVLEDRDLHFVQEDLPKCLNSINVGAQRIREIVLALRNFSRLDEADRKSVNIHEGIESVLLILQHRLKHRSVQIAGMESYQGEIEIVKDYQNIPDVECYPGQLNQVFLSLLTNAIDAIEESLGRAIDPRQQATGKIQICTKIIEKNWVSISVSDNGIGINDAVSTKLFDPFFTTKPIGKGAGLGLFVGYQIIVEKHGGKLTFNTPINGGAEFTIQIPVHQQPIENGKWGTGTIAIA